jgi:hypothetical protein
MYHLSSIAIIVIVFQPLHVIIWDTKMASHSFLWGRLLKFTKPVLWFLSATSAMCCTMYYVPQPCSSHSLNTDFGSIHGYHRTLSQADPSIWNEFTFPFTLLSLISHRSFLWQLNLLSSPGYKFSWYHRPLLHNSCPGPFVCVFDWCPSPPPNSKFLNSRIMSQFWSITVL